MTFQKPLKDLWHVTYEFGKWYEWGKHKGLDLRTICVKYPDGVGMPVYAIADGVWERVGFDEKGGNYVKLRHANGYQSLSFHLSEYAYINGWTDVKKGDLIGLSGNTGKQTTAAHLELRLLKDGIPIDPLPLLENFKTKEDKPDKNVQLNLIGETLIKVGKEIIELTN